jgi:hypothetical protein
MEQAVSTSITRRAAGLALVAAPVAVMTACDMPAQVRRRLHVCMTPEMQRLM